MTEKINLPTRHSANFTIEERSLPAEFDFNFTYNLQNIQKFSMKILLKHEKNNLPDHFTNINLHQYFS